MKKGLINIIILILLITNIALTAIMAFAVVPAMNSTNRLVGKVADAIDLQKDASENNGNLGIDDMDTYSFENKITANLKTGNDGKSHYVSLKVTMTLNKKDEGYSKYKDKLAKNEEYIRSQIIDIIGQYTNDTIADNKQVILDKILLQLREFFNNTKFIHNVTFSEFIIS